MVVIDFNTLILAMVNGLFVGVGSTLGAYFATKLVIKRLEKIEQKLLDKANR